MVDDQYTHEANTRGTLRKAFAAFVIVALLTLAFGLGRYSVNPTAVSSDGTLGLLASPSAIDDSFNTRELSNVLKLLKESYVDKDHIDSQALSYGAIAGMVDAVGDPYTIFFSPREASALSETLSGTLEGIGAEIGIKRDILTVIAPLPNSPAERAGLRAGDRILAINDTPTATMLLDEAIAQIRGDAGTSVKLDILPHNERESKTVNITRAHIVIDTLMWHVDDQGVAYVKLRAFTEVTGDQFRAVGQEIAKRNVKGVILDLRNNPGGYLEGAVAVSSLWVDGGKNVVTERFSTVKADEHPASGRSWLKGMPTVVLVNQGTASAAEIVAGALQDYQLATVIGEKTFGKGSVQELKDFSDGSVLKVTVAKWFTPDNRSIADEGITPDELIELNKADYDNDRDPQLLAARQRLTP